MRTWKRLLCREEKRGVFLKRNGEDVKMSHLEKGLAFLFLGQTHDLLVME